MIVVVIIGVLAAAAIQAYLTFIRRAQTGEAFDKLQLLYASSARYVLDSNEAVDRSTTGAVIGAQFPRDAPLTPPTRCCLEVDGRCNPAWSHWEAHETWRTLDFNMPDPHRFQYVYDSEGEGAGAYFTARASADFDCDNVLSTYERCGFLTNEFDVIGSRGVYIAQELD